MKTTKPLSEFFARMQSFKPLDIAVLFGLMACQESGDEIGMPISPSVVKRLWCVDATESELIESVGRLVTLGEVVEVDDGSKRGYRVSRMEWLQAEFGRVGWRTYARLAQRKHREASKQAAGV